MITIFSIPKPFNEHINIIQENAIKSWKYLNPKCQIIILGDEFGIKDTATKYDVLHIPDILKNEYGTPLLNDAFKKARGIASNDSLAYVNSDIILFTDFIEAVKRVKQWRRDFLISGRRWNIEIKKKLDFDNVQWERQLKKKVYKSGVLDGPSAMDYFILPTESNLFQDMPPFAVGRPFWDNWFLYNARKSRIPVVDATDVNMVIHQKHDYQHVKFGIDNTWLGPEAKRNAALLGGGIYRFDLSDASHHLMKDWSIKHPISRKYFRKQWKRLPVLIPTISSLFTITSKFRKMFNKRRKIK